LVGHEEGDGLARKLVCHGQAPFVGRLMSSHDPSRTSYPSLGRVTHTARKRQRPKGARRGDPGGPPRGLDRQADVRTASRMRSKNAATGPTTRLAVVFWGTCGCGWFGAA